MLLIFKERLAFIGIHFSAKILSNLGDTIKLIISNIEYSTMFICTKATHGTSDTIFVSVNNILTK